MVVGRPEADGVAYAEGKVAGMDRNGVVFVGANSHRPYKFTHVFALIVSRETAYMMM